MHGLQPRQEDACQVAHFGGVQEIGLHEHLDRAAADLVLVAHGLGHLNLHVKGQLFGGPPRQQMQMAAHRPQKAFGGGEAGKFVFGKNPKRHQIGRVVDAVNVFGDPE